MDSEGKPSRWVDCVPADVARIFVEGRLGSVLLCTGHCQLEFRGSFDDGAALLARSAFHWSIPEFVHDSMQVPVDMFQLELGLINQVRIGLAIPPQLIQFPHRPGKLYD